MGYHEGLSIVFMRDTGPRSSIRMRRRRFIGLMVFFACLPFVCIALGWGGWHLWCENQRLTDAIERLQGENAGMRVGLSRLENLETLLDEGKVPGREIVIRQLAQNAKTTPVAPVAQAPAAPAVPPKDQSVPSSAPSEGGSADEGANAAASGGENGEQAAEGPGHEEFPAVDTGYVRVENVQARALRDGRLRLALDLYNGEQQKQASGRVDATLLTADGTEHPLQFEPSDVGFFRINRFKRAVMLSHPQPGLDLENCRLIVHITMHDGGEVVFRNIYAVER